MMKSQRVKYWCKGAAAGSVRRSPVFVAWVLMMTLCPAAAEAQQQEAVVTEHSVTVNGQEVPYRATVGFLPVYDDYDEVVASLHYTFYERTDVSHPSQRPLSFSFNGGPGSASLWMHIGYTGPRLLEIDDEGFPIQPYGFRENPHSVIDVTDIVFVNPVNTGYSRPAEGVNPRRFYGLDNDIDYLAEWIRLFVTRADRWDSPKFLIGESYGTTRVAGLAARLQDRHWMYLNGVVLVSPTDLGVPREGPVGAALELPHYAATAWYHGLLDPELQDRDLEEWIEEVERFTIEEYIPALARGGFLSQERRRSIATRVARYAGVSPQFVLNHNLAVPADSWRKELLRHRGLSVGRLDSRYAGLDREAAGVRYDYDPALSAWNHAFAPAINVYFRRELGYETDVQYNVFGRVSRWDREGDTGERLRQAMAKNPHLQTLFQAGYYDGGRTNYFAAKYAMWNMDPSGRLRDRLHYVVYRSGHMMYLRRADLEGSNEDIRAFIRNSIPSPGSPARH